MNWQGCFAAKLRTRLELVVVGEVAEQRLSKIALRWTLALPGRLLNSVVEYI